MPGLLDLLDELASVPTQPPLPPDMERGMLLLCEGIEKHYCSMGVIRFCDRTETPSFSWIIYLSISPLHQHILFPSSISFYFFRRKRDTTYFFHKVLTRTQYVVPTHKWVQGALVTLY